MALLGRAAAAAAAGNTILSASYNAEHNQMVGASGVFNGGGSGFRILTKYTHATEPVYELDQLGAGAILLLKQNGVTKATITNGGALSLAAMTACPNVNADQVDGIEGANIAKLDTHKTAFSTSWQIVDPSTFTVADYDILQVFIVPAGVSIAITEIRVCFRKNVHTAGGSLTFAVDVRNSTGGGGVVGAVSLNNTNNTVRNVYTATLNQALNTGDQVVAGISARSGTITEQNVTVAITGTQKFTT